MWEVCFVDWNNYLVPVLFKPLSFLHSCSFHWNVFYHLSTPFFIKNVMLILGYRLYSFGSALRLVVSRRHCVAPLLGLRLLLGYCYDYMEVLCVCTRPNWKYIITAQNAWPRTRMALCCQNRVSKGTNQCYGLHVRASISVHSASVTC